ncbi:hypothetical protein [Enterocloster sp.]|uniref:hypothetical protein n=1 Tax=Enterocloster sp. TaxID=2719315 RepID=UPI00399FB4E0
MTSIQGAGNGGCDCGGDGGEASEELVRKAQAAADQLKDNYEDYLAKSGTITYQDVDITLYLKQGQG